MGKDLTRCMTVDTQESAEIIARLKAAGLDFIALPTGPRGAKVVIYYNRATVELPLFNEVQ